MKRAIALFYPHQTTRRQITDASPPTKAEWTAITSKDAQFKSRFPPAQKSKAKGIKQVRHSGQNIQQSNAYSLTLQTKQSINKTQSKTDSSSTSDKAFNQQDRKLIKQIPHAKSKSQVTSNHINANKGLSGSYDSFYK